LQSSLNLSDDHLDGDRVVSTARHDYIRIPFARLDKLAMHRLNCRQILLDDFIERPAAHVNVALDPADQSDVGIGIHEHFHVAQIADPLVNEEKNSVDDHNVSGLDSGALGPPKVGDEIVFRLLDRIPVAQRIEMLAQ